MDFDGSVLKATVPGVFLPKPGKPMWLTVRRDRCFVFPHPTDRHDAHRALRAGGLTL
jgi:iron(III) transport system ATP-binding protein